jgi:DNA-binding transcriptional LysR family regulator
LDVKLSDASAEIRVAVLGEWVPSQLADVLALQRAEEPETAVALIGGALKAHTHPLPCGDFDFALSTAACEWPGWLCEPLWHDTLAVAVAKRSHLLAYREVPRQEVLKQPLINAQPTFDEPWHAVAHRLFENALADPEQTVSTFDMAMALVSAGYGIAIAPAMRLAGHLHRGIAMRPVADSPTVVTTYLLHPCASLTEPQTRFIQRACSMS